MIRAAASLARQVAVLAEARADGELLTAFLTTRDEPAFAELVRRHGPLVWAVCRRLLPDRADAEDAFQAAFLVLVRRARQLTGRAELGPWLYRVAVWTARNIRRRNARRFARSSALSPATPDPSPGPEASDLRADLDRALLALPEKYRDALVLCHLQGWSRREAAERLGCAEGTLSSLLARGLARLRARLRDRDPATALAVAVATVPAGLTSATVRAATAAQLATAGAISASVAQLAEGVLHMLWVKKATAALCGLVVVFGFGVGVGVSVREVPRAAAEDDGPKKPGRGDPRKPSARDDADLQALLVILEKMRAVYALKQNELVAFAEKLSAAREKLRTTTAAATAGKATREDLENIQRAVRGYEEDLKELQLFHSKLRAEIEVLEAAALSAKAAPPKPPSPKADDLERQIRELEAQVERAQAQHAKMVADLKRLQDLRAAQAEETKKLTLELQLKLSQLQKRKAEAAGGKVPPTTSVGPTDRPFFELRVGTKDAMWPFVVKEFGPGGRPIGSVACENAEVLARFLGRVARDSAAPKAVRVVIPPGVPSELVKVALDAVKSSGLNGAVVTKQGPATGSEGADFLRRSKEAERRVSELEELYRKSDRDAEQIQKQMDELLRRKSELDRKEKPDRVLPPQGVPATLDSRQPQAPPGGKSVDPFIRPGKKPAAPSSGKPLPPSESDPFSPPERK